MVNIIGGSGFIVTKFCKSLHSKGIKFSIIDKAMSKTFPQLCKIADVRDFHGLMKTCDGSIIINRIKKFCSNSSFETSVAQTGFIPPVSIYDGLMKTIEYEFINKHNGEVFYSE